ncbi:unnamed protein product, partial [Heligmosomoides polygyrus]|uniref:Protein kinase domain-containing protein n=1 Tax=Heligmosomoides polygyrus TaxID=6339 RepID=A0A183G786_HELPZ
MSDKVLENKERKNNITYCSKWDRKDHQRKKLSDVGGTTSFLQNGERLVVKVAHDFCSVLFNSYACLPRCHLCMSSEELEERLKRELLRKISFVERSTARPTEPVIQQRLRFYGEKCHEACSIIRQARYEYASLMHNKKDLYDRRGGAYHYLVTVKQLYATHKQQRTDLATAAECFALVHDWMQRVEVEYTFIVSRITNCAASYDD